MADEIGPFVPPDESSTGRRLFFLAWLHGGAGSCADEASDPSWLLQRSKWQFSSAYRRA
ncbi:hypothetical protein [Nonomuraea zeae]|uniref:hypothetical protein n=1 Tax=Nonomuraea zeae TaxID=1642303 RepID=UPI001478D272|nr:hypothetical protein [Nonomuraea zeae]